MPVIANICNGLYDDFNIIVAYGIRPDTPDNIQEYFNDRITLVPIKAFTRNVSIEKDIKAIGSIRNIVQKYRPDIIHMHSTKAGLLGRVSLWNVKAKKFYTPHGYCFLKKDDSEIKQKIYWGMEYTLGKLNCTTIACGRNEWEHAKKIRENALYVNNGIDIEKIEMSIKERIRDNEKFTIYTAGRIGPQKNPQLYNRIAEKCPEFQFIWIGDGEERQYLTSPNILVTGLVDNQKVIEIANTCDCFLSCALWEGLPIALIEAMYLGKECVVSNVSGNNELICNGKTGYIVNGLEEYIETLKYASNNKDKYGKAARELIIKKYNKNVMCRGYKKIYEDQ